MHWQLWCVVAIMWLFTACSGPPADPATGAGAQAPAATAPAESPNVILFSWGEYMPEAVLAQFEAETGIGVDYVTYDSQEEAVAAIRSGTFDFDIAVIAYDWAPALRDEGLLAKLDHARLPNFKYVSPQFRNLYFDPDNDYTVPYLWGTTGLLVRTDLLKRPVTQWADLWDIAADNKILARPIPSELFGAALLAQGDSLNSEDPAELTAALDHLQEIQPSLVFAPVETDDALGPLLAGETALMIGWSGDAVTARDANPAIAYVLPAEGAPAWVDSFVVSAHRERQAEALALIDFVLRPGISTAISETYYYPSANDAASQVVDETLRADQLLFPTDEQKARLQFYVPHGAEIEQMYEDLWQQFQPGE